jgi:hypothetical protein
MAAFPSSEDARVLKQLDGAMTYDQLRRFRADGVLPRNVRHGLGRGGGSVSATHRDTVTIAQALIAASRPGQTRNECILQVFASRPDLPLPEIGVRNALRQHLMRSQSSSERLIARAIAGKPSDSILTVALDAARRCPQVRRHARRAPAGADRRGFADALAVLAVCDALGRDVVGEDVWAEAFALVSAVALGENATIGAFGTVAQIALDARASRVWSELHGEPVKDKTAADRRVAKWEQLQRCSFDTLLKIRDSSLLVSAVNAIMEAAREYVPEDPLPDRLAYDLAGSPLRRLLLHDDPALLAAGVPPFLGGSLASQVIDTCEPALGYWLDRTTEVVIAHLEDVHHTGRAVLAAAPVDAAEHVTSLLRDIHGFNERRQPTDPHAEHSASALGDIECAFRLLTLIVHSDAESPADVFHGSWNPASHLAVQLGSERGVLEVMRGLDSIIAFTAREHGVQLHDSGLLVAINKLLNRVYGMPPETSTAALAGLMGVSRSVDVALRIGPEYQLPATRAGALAWARTAQCVTDYANNNCHRPDYDALEVIRARLVSAETLAVLPRPNSNDCVARQTASG